MDAQSARLTQDHRALPSFLRARPAVLFSRIDGVKPTVYEDGMHFCIPLIEYPTIYDIRSKPKIIRSPTGTRDLQMVDITLRILYKPQEDAIAVIHQ